MGTPELAAHILEALVASAGANFQVVAVVTRPDQPRGRGQKAQPSEVGAVAAHHAIPLLKPTKIRTPEFLTEIKSFDADLLVVAAYGRILPNEILAAPRIMPINVHASLLPRHRGAAPIEGAILAGDSETGVTIMRISEKMDAGAMLLSRSIPIALDETTGSLKQKLAELGAKALLDALEMLRHDELTETPQEESLATYTKLVTKTDAMIDWNAPAIQIERMTRAYDPWPIARTTYSGSELLIYRARVIETNTNLAAGTIASIAPNPIVRCGTGALELLEVQAPGRKRIPASDWARGRRVAVGQKFGT
jgi:methionyl-tRNA formyltransferase